MAQTCVFHVQSKSPIFAQIHMLIHTKSMFYRATGYSSWNPTIICSFPSESPTQVICSFSKQHPLVCRYLSVRFGASHMGCESTAQFLLARNWTALKLSQWKAFFTLSNWSLIGQVTEKNREMQRKPMFSAVTLMPMAWKIFEGNTLTEGPVKVVIEALNINALPCLSFLAKSCYTFNPKHISLFKPILFCEGPKN